MGLKDLGALLEESTAPFVAPTDTKQALILIIEDDAGVLGALEVLLRKQYRVIPCTSATEALATWDEDIAAVLLDLKLRDHDGFWACDQIRSKNEHVPIIFHSAYQDAKDPIDIINQYQPFGFITKGADVSMLLQTLERATRYYRVIADNKKAVSELQQIRERMAVLSSSSK